MKRCGSFKIQMNFSKRKNANTKCKLLCQCLNTTPSHPTLRTIQTQLRFPRSPLLLGFTWSYSHLYQLIFSVIPNPSLHCLTAPSYFIVFMRTCNIFTNGEILSKGYRPEARGYVICCPRATHEGNESHNHELKAGKWLIFTLAKSVKYRPRFPKNQTISNQKMVSGVPRRK
mgnify:CR=1 FL=1